MSPRILFELELEALKNSVKDMGKQIELVYNKLFEALVNKSREEMEVIVQNDRLINDMQRNIEASCLTLLTKQQPIARDLRMVSAALKVVTDMERMGDHVSDMSELFLRMDLPVMEEFSASLPQMVWAADKIIRDSLVAFGDKEIEKAKAVIAYDDVIDHYFNQVKEDLIME